jgi:hypothetical protein
MSWKTSSEKNSSEGQKPWTKSNIWNSEQPLKQSIPKLNEEFVE